MKRKNCLIFMRYCRQGVNQKKLISWVCRKEAFSFEKIFHFSDDLQLIGNMRSALDKSMLLEASLTLYNQLTFLDFPNASYFLDQILSCRGFTSGVAKILCRNNIEKGPWLFKLKLVRNAIILGICQSINSNLDLVGYD